MPKCTINGTPLEVKEGTTIIEAMHTNHQRIAHYCWHPGLSVAGVCRLCMVEIEGNPRLQIACNTVITEGMKINNTSEKVKDAAKWGLDFHLINHPLDCPICDQAGECGLQEQYMEFGKYDPEMAEHKVKKHKVVDLGPTVVLDSERCILCSRCVRFTTEVSKTEELGIFNRGDRSEIGVVEGKSLDNKYSVNTVDICPVGALTSKDFRFRQRVWYLKDNDTICNGCSTGCSVKTYFNKEGFFRVKPVFNAQVNGHWMCDEGRDIYRFVNKENRYTAATLRKTQGTQTMAPGAAAKELSQSLRSSVDGVAIVLTGQYTSEEYDEALSVFANDMKIKNIYHWHSNPATAQDFDGLLLRGDKNPNTKGLEQALQKFGVKNNWADLVSALQAGKVKTLIVAGPENQKGYTELVGAVDLFAKAERTIWLQSSKIQALEKTPNETWIIPMKSYVEKDGSFVNHSGLKQNFKRVTTVISDSLTLTEAARLIAGQQIMPKAVGLPLVEGQRPAERVLLENRKKNEFVFRRGSL